MVEDPQYNRFNQLPLPDFSAMDVDDQNHVNVLGFHQLAIHVVAPPCIKKQHQAAKKLRPIQFD